MQGNLDIWRDWGWAQNYVEAMHKIARAEGQDYVIASGMLHSLREIVDVTFAHAGLDPQDRLELEIKLRMIEYCGQNVCRCIALRLISEASSKYAKTPGLGKAYN